MCAWVLTFWGSQSDRGMEYEFQLTHLHHSTPRSVFSTNQKFVIAQLFGVVFIPNAFYYLHLIKSYVCLRFNIGVKFWGGFGLPE